MATAPDNDVELYPAVTWPRTSRAAAAATEAKPAWGGLEVGAVQNNDDKYLHFIEKLNFKKVFLSLIDLS